MHRLAELKAGARQKAAEKIAENVRHDARGLSQRESFQPIPLTYRWAFSSESREDHERWLRQLVNQVVAKLNQRYTYVNVRHKVTYTPDGAPQLSDSHLHISVKKPRIHAQSRR